MFAGSHTPTFVPKPHHLPCEHLSATSSICQKTRTKNRLFFPLGTLETKLKFIKMTSIGKDAAHHSYQGMHIKATMRHHCPTRKAQAPHTNHGTRARGWATGVPTRSRQGVERCRHFGGQFAAFLQNLMCSSPYNPAMMLFCIYPQGWKTRPHKTCSECLQQLYS